MEKLYCNIYHPFIDDDHSLWGIDNTILKRSPDYGITWETVFDFSTLGNGVAIPPIFGNIYISKAGYVYVGMKDNYNGQGYLYRSITTRNLKQNNAGLQFELVLRLHKGGFPNPWSITEDAEGVIYVGEYGHKFTGSVDEQGNEIPIGYIYKSDTGELGTWTIIDYFVVNKSARHIHQLQVNPYTNVLYVTIGDADKEDWKSIDKGQNWTKIFGPSPSAGHTGLGFFPDCRVLATDFVADNNPNPGSRGYTNYIRKTTDDITYTTELTLDTDPYNTAFYDLVTIGENTAYALAHDEWDDQLGKCSSIWVTHNRGDDWELFSAGPVGSKEPVYMGIAHGRNNMIPEGFPYLIINNHWTRSDLYPPEDQMHLTRFKISDVISNIYVVVNSTYNILLPIYLDPDYSLSECIKIKAPDVIGYTKLVNPDSIKASPVRIMTANGIRALGK